MTPSINKLTKERAALLETAKTPTGKFGTCNRAIEARVEPVLELRRQKREAASARKVRELMREFVLSLPTRQLQLEALAVIARTEARHAK